MPHPEGEWTIVRGRQANHGDSSLPSAHVEVTTNNFSYWSNLWIDMIILRELEVGWKLVLLMTLHDHAYMEYKGAK